MLRREPFTVSCSYFGKKCCNIAMVKLSLALLMVCIIILHYEGKGMAGSFTCSLFTCW